MRWSSIIAICVLSFTCPRAWGMVMYYEIGLPVVDVSLSYRIRTQESTSGATSNTARSTGFSEKFNIRTGGWVEHPEVLNFSIQLHPQFAQDRNRSDVREPTDRDLIFLGFAVDANVLSYLPYNLNLHAERTQKDITTSRAGGDSTTESSLYSAKLNAKHPVWPSTVTIETRERVHDLFLSTRTEKTDRLRVQSRNKTDASQTKIDAEWQDKGITTDRSAFTAEQISLKVDNHLNPGDRSRAVTRFRHIDRTTGSGSTQTSLSSLLDVDHHDKLASRYEFEYDDHQGADTETSRVYGKAWLRHQLYESLTTTLRADLESREATDSDLQDYGADVHFNYTRPIPWGRLDADFRHGERATDSRRRTNVERVRSEEYRIGGVGFESHVEIGAGATGIDVGTIRVRDQFFQYYCPADGWPEHDDCQDVEAPDYEREEIDGRVYIWAMPAGRLADDLEIAEDGAVTVFVDYEHEANPSYKLTQSLNAFGVGVDLWSKLRLYHRQSNSGTKVVSGTEPKETEFSSQLTGAQLRLDLGVAKSATTIETSESVSGRGRKQTDYVRQQINFSAGSWSATEISAELKDVDETLSVRPDLDSTLAQAQTQTQSIGIRQRFSLRGWSVTTLSAGLMDESLDGALRNGAPVQTQTQTQFLRAEQRFASGGWSNSTALEARDVSVTGDITERTRTPATFLIFRNTFDYKNWSTTDIEAVDTRAKRGPSEFPPSVDREDVTSLYRLRIRQQFTFQPTSTMQVGLSANYNERERRDIGTRWEDAGLSASLRWRLGPGDLAGRLFHDQSRNAGTIIQETARTGLSAKYSWRQGGWRNSVHYSLSSQERRTVGEPGRDQVREENQLFLETSRRF